MAEKSLKNAVLNAASTGKNPAGETYRLLSLEMTRRLAGEYDLPGRLVELEALREGIIPDRYQRSIGTIGTEGQIKLLNSRAGVLGAGGLGGFALELLARMGVGQLVVVDGDVFADSNMNRQLLATEKTIGKAKADIAARRIAEVNSAVEVEAYNCIGDTSNLPGIFKSCDLVLDCLDNLPSRFDLEKVCGQLGIIMIHGAIAGLLGQIAVIRPDRPLLSSIYGAEGESGTGRGVEVQLGNPAATPAMLASWQAGEAVKILAGQDGVLPPDRLLIIDMQSGESYRVEIAG
jgi:molybdopterin-synthase adenylyltransferase